MSRPSLKNLKFPNEAISKARRGGRERPSSVLRSTCSWSAASAPAAAG
jgi:hypothetical protein